MVPDPTEHLPMSAPSHGYTKEGSGGDSQTDASATDSGGAWAFFLT